MLDHVGIAAPNLAQATALYATTFGCPVSPPRVMPDHGIAVVFVETGAARIELIAAIPTQADTLVVCTEGSPDFLNAALSTADTSFDVAEHPSDRLIGMEAGGSGLVPALAKSWSVSEDGLTYTFNLRHGAK